MGLAPTSPTTPEATQPSRRDSRSDAAHLEPSNPLAHAVPAVSRGAAPIRQARSPFGLEAQQPLELVFRLIP